MKILVGLALVLAGLPAIAQLPGEPYLVLDTPGLFGPRRHRWELGDDVTLRLHGQKGFQQVPLQILNDSTLLVGRQSVPLRSVAAVVRYRRGFAQVGGKLMAAGVLLFLIDVINPVLQGEEISVSPTGTVGGGSLVAGGFLLSRFQKRTYRLRGYRQLKVLRVL